MISTVASSFVVFHTRILISTFLFFLLPQCAKWETFNSLSFPFLVFMFMSPCLSQSDKMYQWGEAKTRERTEVTVWLKNSKNKCVFWPRAERKITRSPPFMGLRISLFCISFAWWQLPKWHFQQTTKKKIDKVWFELPTPPTKTVFSKREGGWHCSLMYTENGSRKRGHPR